MRCIHRGSYTVFKRQNDEGLLLIMVIDHEIDFKRLIKKFIFVSYHYNRFY